MDLQLLKCQHFVVFSLVCLFFCLLVSFYCQQKLNYISICRLMWSLWVKINNINIIIRFTKGFYLVNFYNGFIKYEYSKRLITITLITLSVYHCISSLLYCLSVQFCAVFKFFNSVVLFRVTYCWKIKLIFVPLYKAS